MTNDNQPTEELPEGVVVYDHTKYNKDQKLRMLLSAFSQGLQQIGKMCENAVKSHDKEDPIDPEQLAGTILLTVDQTGQHGHSIMGGNDPDFHDDDVTGSGLRKFIPVAEIKKVLEDKHMSGWGSGDDYINETVDKCLDELGIDTSKDEG